ncbi:putative C2H2 transcription factor [Aspergillus puulaauensis]|uniref:C2H2-type domain-containing protein n=1 Tax=Aspergillus puulaauensis TaxID=1220207 RepID=A0A7R7XE52_9EURO|nr:uncharacterized protein APUU_11847A [Aspergillus puulaauensis]BCS19019.1 hypothetical protein APUU_11847A [Aspergillus puulaauensis]
MLLATGLSDGLHGMTHHCDYNHHDSYRILKQHSGKAWKMEDNRARRQRYEVPYTTAAMDGTLLLPDDSMLYTSQASFAPMSSQQPVHLPEEYLPYGSHLDGSSYYPAPETQPYISHQSPYYNPATTTSANQAQPNSQWLHPSHASTSSRHHHHHHHSNTSYQESIPSIASSDLDPDFDVDMDLDLDMDPQTAGGDLLSSPSPNPPSRTPSTHSTNTKDLTLYGTPSLSHPGAWRCAYPNCTSPSLFRRGCDLRKHYNRHRKHLFCRHDGCPQSNPQVPGAGFSSKKDRDRHEAKHNPGIMCEWAGEGCTRVFSRVDNMKDHVRRIHLRVN